MARETVSIKRASMDTQSGQTGDLTVHLPAITCTILVPRNAGLRDQTTSANGQARVNQMSVIFFEQLDIVKGDVLCLRGKEYPITDVTPWLSADPFMVATVEEINAAPENVMAMR